MTERKQSGEKRKLMNLKRHINKESRIMSLQMWEWFPGSCNPKINEYEKQIRFLGHWDE